MQTLTKRMTLDKAAKKYIIEAIDAEGYDNTVSPSSSDATKLNFLYKIFLAEYGWSIARYGEQKAFSEWLMGLPSCFSIDFENYKILELAKTWGYYGKELTPAQEDKILSNWWNFIAVKTFQLFRKYGVIK